MLLLRTIAGGQARYYLEGPAPGRWVGSGGHDLGLDGPVDEDSLRAVLAARRPGGEVLLRRVSHVRRSGFDLILAAPKSVSLLAALGDYEHRARFQEAHRQAVDSTLGYLEQEAVWTRRGRDDTRIPTTGLVAAAFPHSRSATGDPHLHTHVVVANVVLGDDGQWSCPDSRSLYRHVRAGGALFQAALRHHLTEQGLRFDWAVTRHGLGDVVGVPRAAIEAASLRHREVTHEIESGLAGAKGRATAAGRTRPAADANVGHGQSWPQRVADAGLDAARAEALCEAAARPLTPVPGVVPAGPGVDALGHRLSEQHSQFRRRDVIQAAAALAVNGAPAGRLQAAADEYLKTAVPAGDDRWTTATLKRLEEGIVTRAQPHRAAVGLAGQGPPAGDGLRPTEHEPIARLTRGGAPIDLLAGDLINQARVLDAARDRWEESGHRVALLSPTERGQARWRTLAGLEPPPPLPAHATVVVVDNAERWSTTDLHRVVSDAVARQAKLVLLDGGTRPRRARAESPAFETLRATVATIDAGRASPTRVLAPPTAARAAPGPISAALAPPTAARAAPRRQVPLIAELAAPAPRPMVAAGRDGAVAVLPTGQAAMEQLTSDWHQLRQAGRRPRMVALGPEEAEHLNTMARAIRTQAAELKGPAVEIAGRSFQAGDEVAALRRDARLGAVRGGTVGKVTSVDPARHQATILWTGREEAVTVAATGKSTLPLTHGYATTPPYLRAGHDGVVLSLGHAGALAPHLQPDRIYEVAPRPTRDRGLDSHNPVMALLTEISGVSELSGRGRVDGWGPAVSGAASRPLSELSAECERLTDYLRHGVPPDPMPEVRRLKEDREWHAAVPDRPGCFDHAVALTAIERRLATLSNAAADRRQWLEQHRDHLERCAGLSAAIAWREAALGRGAEIRPTVAVLAQIGPPPGDGARRPLWRRAAEAVESHRERFGLADQPLTLAPDSAPALAPSAVRRSALEPPSIELSIGRTTVASAPTASVASPTAAVVASTAAVVASTAAVVASTAALVPPPAAAPPELPSDPGRRADELRIVAAARELQRARSRDHGLSPSNW